MCHVAAEMERQGFDLPLLIGGATTSRVHTAVKIHPNYRRGQTVYVNDASRAVGVAQALMSAQTSRAEIRRRHRAANTPGSPPRMRARRRTRSGCRWRPRAPMRSKLDWSGYAPPKPSFLGTPTCSRIIRSPNWSTTSTGRRSSRPGNWPAIPRDPRRRDGRRGGALALRRRAGDAEARSSPRAGSRPRAVIGLLAGQLRSATTSRVRRRDARQADRDAAHAAPAAGAARGPRQRGAVGFRRAARAACRLHRRLRGHRRHRRGRRSPTASSAPTTTTRRSWSRRWPTAWPKPSPSGCTSACARNSGAMRRTRR